MSIEIAEGIRRHGELQNNLIVIFEELLTAQEGSQTRTHEWISAILHAVEESDP